MSEDKLASERLRGRVEYWKQVATIQMHFNDMCIRTRWLGLTAIATLMAAAAVAAKDNIRVHMPYEIIAPVGLSSILMIVALLLLFALWLLDTHYYYRMLLASVEYGENLEKRVMDILELEGKGVTAFISERVTRRRAVAVSRSFYLITGIVVGLFLLGSFLPKATGAGEGTKQATATITAIHRL